MSCILLGACVCDSSLLFSYLSCSVYSVMSNGRGGYLLELCETYVVVIVLFVLSDCS